MSSQAIRKSTPAVQRPARTASQILPPMPAAAPEPEPADVNPGVASMLSQLNQHYRNLRRHQIAYADLLRQHQSIGAAPDLRVPPLMPKWKSADDNEEMVEVGIDFAWIPDEYLEPMLQTMINACGSQFQESLTEIHRLSGEVLQCLAQLNPEG